MRILRLYDSSSSMDHTICYASESSDGKSCINDEDVVLRAAYAGDKANETAERELTIVLPREAVLKDGFFLSVVGYGTLLRWNEKDKLFTVELAGFLPVSAPVSIWPPLKTAVLTVSDLGSRGERKDTSGPALVSMAGELGCVTGDTKIVLDEIEEISAAVTKWSDEGYNLVLITGGTGLSERDVTPEALSLIAEKNVPGFGEVMRSETLKYTPRAFLSRSLAVIRKKTLIIAFPGSEKAVRQCFEAIYGGLRHGAETLAGMDGGRH